MPAPQSAADFLPRPAPAWVALVVFAVLFGVGWVACDSAGPLAHLRVGERAGPLAAVGRWWFLPPVLSAAAVLAVGGLAVADFARVRRWAGRKEWRDEALDWCARRLLAGQTEEYLKAEVGVVYERLADTLARRWGKYYVTAFALVLVVGLLAVLFVKAPVTGDPAEALPRLLSPLAGATGGLLLVLLVVVAAARFGNTTLKHWREDKEEEVAANSRTAVAEETPQGGEADEEEDGEPDEGGGDDEPTGTDDDPLLGGYAPKTASRQDAQPVGGDDMNL